MRVALTAILVGAVTYGFASPAKVIGADKKPASVKKQVELPRPADAPAQLLAAPALRKPTDFKSTHFLLHTDLASKEAHELLNRLELMLTLIAKYWGHPPVGTIECYVVKDLSVWPRGSMDPAGRAKIEEGAGVTLTETLTLGPKPVASKAVVYAVADRGTPQHEAVHAYCSQAFGHTGPLWYSEGMAEMGQYWYHGDSSVHCHPIVVQYIRVTNPKPLSVILTENSVSGDSWQNYAWRWALCHLLANNPNYAARFRPLGLGFLTGQRVSFDGTYGAMAAEISFEYQFFVRHLDQGYRVDLCSWDWKRKFKELNAGFPTSARVVANRGWQPSSVLVSADKKYDYSASGSWDLSKESKGLTADGQDDGAGRLEGVVFQDFHLSEPFLLGAYGSFVSPEGGQLFLRCRDQWNELADNKGAMNVKIKRADQGQPLARPSGTADDAEETVKAE